MKALGGLLQFLLKLAGLLAFGAVVLKLLFVDVIVMPHNGMAPTLVYGEQVVVWRRATADMGDIMLCQHPRKPGASVIGRAIAFKGHAISADYRGQLMIDDDSASIESGDVVRFYDVTREKLFNMKLGSINYHRKHTHEFFVDADGWFEIPTHAVEQGIFLLGDNRAASYDDSRDFGDVDPASCRGEIFFRLAPAPDRGDDIHHGYLEFIH